MTFSNPQRVLLFLLTAGVLQTHAFPPDGALNSLIPTFALIGGDGGSETGRCTGADLDHLKASYEDMCLMAQLARDEIDFLLDRAERTGGAGPPKPDNKEAPEADINEWKRWSRVRGTYLSLFGVDPFTKHEDVRGTPGELQAGQPIKFYNKLVRDFYDRVDTEYCGGAAGPDDPLVVCTDAHYQFVKVGTVDPGDTQRRNIEITHPQCRNVGGVWYSPNMPPAHQYYERPRPENPGDGPLCNNALHDLAVTMVDWDTIIFCKNGLDTNVMKTITLQDLRNNVKPTKERYRKQKNRETILQALGFGRVTKLEDIKGDGGQIMPLTWLHELHHLATDSHDQPAIDEEGNRLKITERVYDAQTNEYVDEDVDEKAYGYELARNLALRGGSGGMLNPDNIAFFALAMFFREHDWSRGFAMPVQDPFESAE